MTTRGARVLVEVCVEDVTDLHELAGGRIIILAAGGIRPETVRKLLRDTGVREVHGRALRASSEAAR